MTAPARTDRTPTGAREADATAAFVEFVAERAAELVLERFSDPKPASPYLNVAEAADYLRCDRQRIYDLLSSRRLTKLKDGSRVLLWRAELDDLVASALPSPSVARLNARDAA